MTMKKVSIWLLMTGAALFIATVILAMIGLISENQPPFGLIIGYAGGFAVCVAVGLPLFIFGSKQIGVVATPSSNESYPPASETVDNVSAWAEPASATDTVAQGKFCSQCGKTLDIGAAFCGFCGQKTSE